MVKTSSIDIREYKIIAMNKKAEKVVAEATAKTMAIGAVPIPFADAPFLIGEQVSMMGKICEIFEIDVFKDGLKMLATAVIGVGGATIMGKSVVTGILKCIPGAGTVVGCAVSGSTAGIITLALGKAFIEVCKMVKLGQLSEADLTSPVGISIMKDKFMEQVMKSKK